MTCFEDVAKLLQFNVILNLIHLGYIWYIPNIIKGTVKGQGSLTYYPYPYPQVPLPITLKGYPYPCYCLCGSGSPPTGFSACAMCHSPEKYLNSSLYL